MFLITAGLAYLLVLAVEVAILICAVVASWSSCTASSLAPVLHGGPNHVTVEAFDFVVG